MIDRDLLFSTTYGKGLRFKDLAEALGVSKESFSRKLANDTFNLEEITTISNVLKLSNSARNKIFFGK